MLMSFRRVITTTLRACTSARKWERAAVGALDGERGARLVHVLADQAAVVLLDLWA